MHIISLIIGGSLGTLSRHFIGKFANILFGPGIPYGTLIANILGCFFVGLIAVIADTKLNLDHNMKLLLIVGFCGALTTFSTFILDIYYLIKSGSTLIALLYLLSSIFIGFGVFLLGISTGKSIL